MILKRLFLLYFDHPTLAEMSSPIKQSIKRKQGQIKCLVNSFCTLLLAWNNDVEQVSILLDHYKGIVNKIKLIHASQFANSSFAKSMFNDAILPQIHMEMESVLIQVRSFG